MQLREFDSRVMAGPMSWSYAWGECLEFLAEVRALSWAGMVDEASDAVLCLQLALFHSMRGHVSWPLLLGRRSARKFEARLTVWEDIFRAEGVPFDKRFLVGGGNYNRPEKVEAALNLGRSAMK